MLLENISIAIDYENGQQIKGDIGSKVFKRGTNLSKTVTCVVGAKVMFLTNSILDKGISNKTYRVIIYLRGDNEVDIAFLTREGILVRISPFFRVKPINII